MNSNTPNADEIVMALRCEHENCVKSSACVYWSAHPSGCLMYRMHRDAANLIQSLTTQLAASQCRAQDARNELCMKCGRYHEAHKGVCDGCRWKEN